MADAQQPDQLFRIIPEKCTRCYACLRDCPVNAIVVKKGSDIPEILDSRCIGCGNCFHVCGFDAVVYRSSTAEVTELLRQEAPVIALLGPSIAAEFVDISDYRKLVAMIRALGFAWVQDVSFGVDLVAGGYANLASDFKGKYYLFSNCPVVVNLLQKYYPDLLVNAAPLVSPPVAAAGVVRKKYGPECKVVYIGPCIASKDEIRNYHGSRAIDANITFLELRQLFEKNAIDEKNYEYAEFDAPLGYKGALYPITNGILQSGPMDESLLSGNVISADGHDDVLEAIKMFRSHSQEIKHHFNLFFCEGCMMGPGMTKGGEKFYRMAMITDFASRLLKDFNYDRWSKEVDEYRTITLSRSFTADDQRIVPPSEEKINQVLTLIGKSDSRYDSGCRMCGFNSCREFAVMVANGLAKPEMCIEYTLRTRQEYINTLKNTNEKLSRDYKLLAEETKEAKHSMLSARESAERAAAILARMNSGVVIVDSHFKIIESNAAFIAMLGEEVREIAEIIPGLAGADLKTLLPYAFYNVFNFVFEQDQPVLNKDIEMENGLLNVTAFPIRSAKIAGAIVRDMFLPEVQKEEVINRMNEIIDENLAMVQQIGFLLGEGASKTEKMLNSIIQSYKSKQ
ncbi:MAG: [Fe-Fe] hydrogenase large subunit C-terminal domain-containing protein [Bacteroidales bacterium]|nr:[Fe-Fe] hydrogenase large subunit C-terminal domain-containing protein [Bacteroidales bacterium]HPE86890.1 [Fe-Fe] hydrogenase large subunit C-terminal domain-containing protein [Bacteroidales bacterium]